MSIGSGAPGVSSQRAMPGGQRWRGILADESAAARSDRVRPRGLYLHVPFCATRCGYCDFNTYTAPELRGAHASDYADLAIAELRQARAVWNPDPLDTVFIGGGTPTLLPPEDLARILDSIREEVGLRMGAEITIEANPDSVDPAGLSRLRDAGVTRMSFGVQSLAPGVLATLDRTHTPGRALAAIGEARAAGFDQVSADLIYATPGETADDWAATVDAVLEAGIDHLSAYSLIVEPGTRLATRVRRGELPMPDDDTAADRYAHVDARAVEAGLPWYEVSNWARPGAECRHNLGYWRDGDWWGIGPGAHGHIGRIRWWNVKHPSTYGDLLRAGALPVEDGEVLDDEARAVERVMLGLRLREGLAIEVVAGRSVPADLVESGLVEVAGDRVVLSDRGRLLADAVIRRLLA